MNTQHRQDYLKRYYQEHKEQYRQYSRHRRGTHYEEVREYEKEYRKKWVKANPEKARAQANAGVKRRHKKLKMQALTYYGGDTPRCACPKCLETNIAFLTIDHINGDGAAHRKTFNGTLYNWLHKNNYPDGFRVLCYNCNIASYHNGGVCPHLEEEK